MVNSMKKVPLSPHTIQIQLYGNWQQKSTIISTATQILLFLLLICPFQKGRMRNIQSLRRCPRRYFALHPYVITFFKLIWLLWWSAKSNAPQLCRCYPFCLTLFDQFPFRLCYIGQQLQNNIGNQRSCQVTLLFRVQQRHIQNYERRPFVFCDEPPLFYDFFIIAPQTVNAGTTNTNSIAGCLLKKALSRA